MPTLPTVVGPRLIEIVLLPFTVILAYLAHEMMHLSVYWVTKTPYRLEVSIRSFFSFTGQAVHIESENEVSNRFKFAQSMAPLILFIPSLVLWMGILTKPVVSIGLASNAFLLVVIALPSPIDFAVAINSLNID